MVSDIFQKRNWEGTASERPASPVRPRGRSCRARPGVSGRAGIRGLVGDVATGAGEFPALDGKIVGHPGTWNRRRRRTGGGRAVPCGTPGTGRSGPYDLLRERPAWAVAHRHSRFHGRCTDPVVANGSWHSWHPLPGFCSFGRAAKWGSWPAVHSPEATGAWRNSFFPPSAFREIVVAGVARSFWSFAFSFPPPGSGTPRSRRQARDGCGTSGRPGPLLPCRKGSERVHDPVRDHEMRIFFDPNSRRLNPGVRGASPFQELTPLERGGRLAVHDGDHRSSLRTAEREDLDLGLAGKTSGPAGTAPRSPPGPPPPNGESKRTENRRATIARRSFTARPRRKSFRSVAPPREPRRAERLPVKDVGQLELGHRVSRRHAGNRVRPVRSDGCPQGQIFWHFPHRVQCRGSRRVAELDL